MTAIKSLTQEQINQMPGWVDKWVKIGLSTEPADFDKAEVAIRKCYTLINAPQPEKILREASPMAAIRHGLEEEFRLRGHKDKSGFKDFAKQNLSQYRGGQFWASWTSYITFFRDVCGFQDPTLEKFKLDEDLTMNCGLVWWGDKVAAISDRPTRIFKDQQQRLHNDKGPAIEYRDGWGVYCWHGYRIPKNKQWMIQDKEKITADGIEAEINVELRRIMLEIFGYENYLKVRKATLVAEDKLHGQKRRLLEFRLNEELIRVVEVVNGTQEPDGTYRKFILGCIKVNGKYPNTPHEAIAWSYGINPDTYKESIRT